MAYLVTLTFEVKKIRSKNEAREFAVTLAEHVLDTFNDDESINPYVAFEVEHTPRKEKT